MAKPFGILLILLSLCILYVLKTSGAFHSIKPHFDGTQEILESPPGIEDITIDQGNGRIYLSSTDRRDNSVLGDIYTFDLAETKPKYKPLNIPSIYSEFKPHGISLFKKNGQNYLFAISHEGDNEYVYRFEIQSDSIVNSKKFEHELFISPNDIVATDTASFYFTNDHGMKLSKKRTILDFLLDKNGFVVSYQNGIAKKVSQQMAYANGINVSNDGKYLFVSSTIESKLYVYKNDPNADQLELLDEHFADSGLDNIEVDRDGNLLVAGHPKLLKFQSHAKDSKKRSPSQLLKIVYLPETNYKFLQEELYLNDGNPLSACSVGTYYVHKDGQNDLILGSVFDEKIMRLHRNL